MDPRAVRAARGRHARRGHPIPEALQANVRLWLPVGESFAHDTVTLPATVEASALCDIARKSPVPYVVAMDEQRIAGFLAPADVAAGGDGARASKALSAILRTDFVSETGVPTLEDLLGNVRRQGASVAILRNEDGSIRNVVPRAQLVDAVAEGLDLFGE